VGCAKTDWRTIDGPAIRRLGPWTPLQAPYRVVFPYGTTTGTSTVLCRLLGVLCRSSARTTKETDRNSPPAFLSGRLYNHTHNPLKLP